MPPASPHIHTTQALRADHDAYTQSAAWNWMLSWLPMEDNRTTPAVHGLSYANGVAEEQRPLDTQIHPKFYYAKKKDSPSHQNVGIYIEY
jgi:hypothetical protein